MKRRNFEEGLTLVVVPDHYQADLDTSEKEEVLEDMEDSEEVEDVVDPNKKTTLQILNIVLFWVMIFSNMASTLLLDNTLAEISA